MGYENFKQQLMELGYEPKERGDNCLSFSYTVQCGKFLNKNVELGLCIPNTFPEHPPSGPHFSECLLPLNPTGGSHPLNGIHSSAGRHGNAFDGTWQYWSRPFNGWATSEKSVKSYLRHINHLMDTI